MRDGVVIVTGGGGAIGSAVVAELVSRGARAAIIDADIDRALRVAATVGADTMALQADVTNPSEVDASVESGGKVVRPDRRPRLLHRREYAFVVSGNES